MFLFDMSYWELDTCGYFIMWGRPKNSIKNFIASFQTFS